MVCTRWALTRDVVYKKKDYPTMKPEVYSYYCKDIVRKGLELCRKILPDKATTITNT